MFRPDLVPDKVKLFMVLQPSEEAISQPYYHYLALAASAITSLTFFGETVNDTNLQTTNLVVAGAFVTNPKRYAIEGIGLDIIPGVNPSQTETASGFLNTFINDLWKIASVGSFVLKLIDTDVLSMAPLYSLPGGVGLDVKAAASAYTLASAADRSATIAYGTNGMPSLHGFRWFKAPLPMQKNTTVKGTINWPTAPSLSAAAKVGARSEGVEYRPAVGG